MNLFELNDAYRQLKDRDDLDPTVLNDSLDAIKDDREQKLDNIASWIDSNEADTDWLTKRIKKLQEKKKYLENQSHNLMTYLTQAIDDAGIKKMRTEHHMLSTRNYKASTIIDDEDKIPAEYRNYAKYEGKFDVKKADVYKALKAGQKVPGAHLQDNRRTVIK